MLDEETLRRMISIFNRDLPRQRISLASAVRSDKATYEGRDDRRYVIAREEVKRIAEIIPEDRWLTFSLPIVLRGDPLSESPGWIVEGADECRVVAAITGKSPIDGSESSSMKLYWLHMMELRKALPTATVVMSSI